MTPPKLLPTLALGIFLGALDMNILALALPRLALVFDVPESATVWIVTAYSAAYVVAMPLIGRLGDMFGRRRAFVAGLGLFTFGSLLCALAGWAGAWWWLLLAGRALQGVGAGGMVPVATALIGQHVPAEQRGKALGVVGMCFAAASILGPIAGGLLLDHAGWEWLFAANLPVGLAAMAMAWRFVPASAPADRGAIDWAGGALLSLSLGSLMAGAAALEANLRVLMPWYDGPVLLFGFVALAAGAGFVARERATDQPMLDLGLYGVPAVRRAFAVAFLYGAGMLIAMVFPPLLFHYRFGLEGLWAGLCLLPMALTSGYAAMKGGKLSDRRGPRAVMSLGCGLFALGLAALAWLIPWAPLWAVLAAMMVVGLGFGYGHAPLSHVVLRAVDPRRHGQATGALNTHRSLGGVVGATLGAWLIAEAMAKVGTRMIAAVGGQLPPSCVIPTVIDPHHVEEMVALLPAEARPLVLETARTVVSEQMASGLAALEWVGAAALLLACVLALGLPGRARQAELVVPAAAPSQPPSPSAPR